MASEPLQREALSGIPVPPQTSPGFAILPVEMSGLQFGPGISVLTLIGISSMPLPPLARVLVKRNWKVRSS